MILQGDCLDRMAELESGTIDLIVTDPPYGYSFMGKDWDKAVPSVEIWTQALRVLKPGAFMFVMSAPRSDVQNAMISRIMDAGFRMDFTPIYWTYASGFPKAGNIGKLVDKRLGLERSYKNDGRKNPKSSGHNLISVATSVQAKALNGSYAGFQPKPAVEVVLVAMKPLEQKTFVDQALDNGKGVTWLDDVRIPTLQGSDPQGKICVCLKTPIQSSANNVKKQSNHIEQESVPSSVQESAATNPLEKAPGKQQEDTFKTDMSCSEEILGASTNINSSMSGSGSESMVQSPRDMKSTTSTVISKTTDSKTCNVCQGLNIGSSTEQGLDTTLASGRFPANLLVSDDVLNDGKITKSQGGDGYKSSMFIGGKPTGGHGLGDSGSYSRYFDIDKWWAERLKELPESVRKTFPYLIVPKASKGEKNQGLDSFELTKTNDGRAKEANNAFQRGSTLRNNPHPTVKPVKLMSYLITLGSRKGDTVLDPFVGSGTTCIAAKMIERKYIGIEKDPDYVEIAKARLEATREPEITLGI